MEYPFSPDDRNGCRRARNPVAAWFLVAMIAVVLGAASIAAGLSTDTRDFATRHASVLQRTAL